MAETTGVRDGSVIDVATAKAWCRVENDDEDAIFSILVEAGKEQADQYLNNPLEDGVPKAVELWVLKFVAMNYEHRELGLEEETVDDLGDRSWVMPECSSIFRWRIFPGFGSANRDKALGSTAEEQAKANDPLYEPLTTDSTVDRVYYFGAGIAPSQ